ncbi:Xaa-Pro aminopeptidase [Modicisalibacter xianhensis]|uniref:Xaa-Pro aminopeptidase n=1 Tax=Modicisalibacter xianhensis TaxID=442341 RepID=A0A4R8FVK9_9GAMM|nr:Xaa-Pro peptidase family protein [Halomonas xianhensis]TDX30868.1 Xaa-Pro aminopeptidase [Halomonas xianhensis]
MDFDSYRERLTGLAGSECVFSEDELQRRRQMTRQRMNEAGLTALLLTSPADIYYLTGYSTFEVSVHTALMLTEDRLTLQVPSIETGPAVACTRIDDIRSYRWENIDEVLDPLMDALTGCHGRIGIDPWQGGMRHGLVQGLKERMAGCEFLNAGDLLPGVKIVKSAEELDCLAESARLTGLGIEAAADAVGSGVLDSEVAAEGARALHAAGSEFMSMQPIVTSGPRSSVIHLNHKRCRINEGDPVFLEFGAAWQRYTAPMMRTLVAGRPSSQMIHVFDTCRRIYDALIGAIRPGESFDSAAQAAEKALAPLQEHAFFSGVFGYTVGAQFPPSWVEGSGFIARGHTKVFEPGMVFHLPLCLRLPGQWGIGCSDTVCVTEDGALPLTDNPWTLASTQ